MKSQILSIRFPSNFVLCCFLLHNFIPKIFITSKLGFPIPSISVSEFGRLEGGRMADFDDWEILQAEIEELEGIRQGVEAEGLMMLRFDYFSIDSGNTSEVSIEERSFQSDGPSWIDPVDCNAVVFGRRNYGELWPDSDSDRSKSSDCEEKIGLGFVESDDDHQVFEVENQGDGVGELELGYGVEGEASGAVECDGINELENMIVISDESAEKMEISVLSREDVANVIEMGTRGAEGCVEAAGVGKIGNEVKRLDEVEKNVVIWWKVPLELVKFCVFRVSPLWSISVAAAMVGVFIMRRKLQNMKRKSKGLPMKVTVDHKKVDQFINRVARLNEAFSVVKRVPIIRPSLPAPGVTITPWPVLTMR